MTHSDIWLFLAVPLVALVEVVLSARWNRAYFLVGIPIFVRRVERPGGLADVDLEALDTRTRNAAGTELVFRRLDMSAIAFREKFFSGGMLHYTPIMHGVLRHYPGEPHVRVIGLVNWFVLALLACFSFLLGRHIVDLLPMFLLVFAVIYLIQAVRWNRVAKALLA